MAAPLTSGGNLNAMGDKRERRPSPVEQHSGKNDQATRDRTNRGTLPKLGDRGQRCRVDGELAVVRNGLDHEDPGVCAPKPTTDRASKADVVARIAIILRQQLRPIGAQPHAFPSDHRRVEVGLQQTCACRQTLKYR